MRRRADDRLTLRAHAPPVEYPLGSNILDVEWLAGADDGDTTCRGLSERLQHRVTDVADLDALAPLGMLRHEPGVKLGQRSKLLAVLNIRVENGHQVEVALARSERTSRERPEQIEAAQVGPEVTSDERRDSFKCLARL